MINFGDGISWDHHVDQVVNGDNKIHHTGDGTEVWVDAKDHIKTDTPPDERKALDCGCHIGRWIDVVRAYGFDYTGVDQSEKALNKARELRPDGKFIHTFLWDMKFDEEFDFAITVAVLQHNKLEEQEKIVPQIYKALKPGGIFCMAESTLIGSNTTTQRTQDSWIDLFERNGFKLVKTFKKNPIGVDDHYIFLKEK